MVVVGALFLFVALRQYHHHQHAIISATVITITAIIITIIITRQGPRLTLGSQAGERTPKKSIF